MDEELGPQARAARATYLLVMRTLGGAHQLTSREIAEATGLGTAAGVRYLMDNLTLAGVPVWQPGPGLWALNTANWGKERERGWND